MRILLINTNRETRPYPVIPIGLACVARALEQAGHEAHVCDLTFARDPHRAIGQAVQRGRPGLIGLSIRNLDNSSYAGPLSYLPDLQRVAAECRAAGPAPLVIGGPAVGVAPRQLLQALQADWAVAGEGESAAVALADALEKGQAGLAIPGVMTPSGACPSPVMGLLPTPVDNLTRYVDVRPYLRRGAALPIQTRRGCRFRCAYCTYPAVEGAAYRTLAPRAVLEEMAALSAASASRCFEFVDSTFNVPLPYAQLLCDQLARLPRPYILQASGYTPAFSSLHLLRAMRRAGFRTLVCSPDSAADPVLAALDKGFDRAALEALVAQARAAGLVTLWSFLFGGPAETEETVRETLRFIAGRLSGRDLVFIAAGVRIYPGTPLERLARAEGLLAPDDDLLAPRFYLSPHLSLPRLRQLFADHLPGTRNCVFISDMQHSLVPWLERAATALGVPPPLWRFGPTLRRWIPHHSRVLPDEKPGA